MYRLLYTVDSSEDIKNLSIDKLDILADEMRTFLIDNVSKTGGHLASNLGTVELTIALHKVFETPKDKIIWDVGHQSYVHKIITGRREKFSTIRQLGGISGFPKTEESEHDIFNTGHSSTSISAALGFAKARDISGEDFCSLAVIGDGALTGGMAFEALNHAGNSKTSLIVILNDNGMSISKNVGGMAKYLNVIRNRPFYFAFKKDIKWTLRKIPFIGKKLERFFHKIKMGLKQLILQGIIFEDLGFSYMGPVDGHDLESLINVLREAKLVNGPVLVHVKTQKGKGYRPAEKNPGAFHGIGSFNIETGEVSLSSNSEKVVSYSTVFGNCLCSIAMENQKVTAITAAMADGTGLEEFKRTYKNRFFDVGIAEQHGVTFAAGLAKAGMIPVFAVYSSFLQRGYDQILHDVALQNLHVIFAVDRAGLVGSDGETHQGIYDLSYLMHMPNLTVLAPSSGTELSSMLRFAIEEIKGPVAIRYPRGTTEVEAAEKFNCKGRVICDGEDVLIVSLGSMLYEAEIAKNILEGKGVSVGLIDARIAKPLDKDLIKRYADKCKVTAVIEDNAVIGGFGQAVQNAVGGKILKFGFPDVPICHGNIGQLREKYGLSGVQIAQKILDELK